MCGIFGWFGVSPDGPQQLFTTLSPLLHHRGPDDQGFEYAHNWGLGFRRLSILDLSGLGHQPMRSANGRFWLAFNGEIYNYLELRQALTQAGETFRSTSDTEVLLKLLAREGSQALERLNGMFALAFVDTVEQTFLLARDRLGVKPLYYHNSPGQLRFASELKSLVAWPQAPREINPQAVVEYLALSYLSNETCIFGGYQKLAPGHFITGSLDKPEQAQPKSYWHLEINDGDTAKPMAERDLETLADLLRDAVQIRLRSDVPVGVFLSGGIDSGLVTAMTNSNGNVQPLALTVGFTEEDFDETALAQATAQQAGLEHRIITQRQSGLTDVDRLAWFYDEPFGDVSALPTMTLCEAAAEHATVFLSGDGGDEAFGGYRRYVETQHYTWLGKLPMPLHWSMRQLAAQLPVDSRLRYRLLKSSQPDMGFAAAFDGWGLVDDPMLHVVLPGHLKSLATTGGDPLWQRWGQSRGQNILTRQQILDYGLYLPDDILVKMDRASMAHSIEVRSPFLDYRLVEWAARLPRATLLNSDQGKLPLRALGKKLLPPTVQRASKAGFGVPVNAWFRESAGQNFARERLLSTEARQRGLWDINGVEYLLQAHQAKRGRNFGELLWRLLMLDAWARQYLDDNRFLQGAPPQA